jgi:hypothetical protein
VLIFSVSLHFVNKCNTRCVKVGLCYVIIPDFQGNPDTPYLFCVDSAMKHSLQLRGYYWNNFLLALWALCLVFIFIFIFIFTQVNNLIEALCFFQHHPITPWPLLCHCLSAWNASDTNEVVELGDTTQSSA